MTAEPDATPVDRSAWSLPDDVVYLNHGSFGPSPICVQESFQSWSERLEQQPMNFFLRKMEEQLERALDALSEFVGTSRSNLVFVDNATFGMNIVAASVPLQSGDEVLLNDHEYGAVTRIWKRRCRQTGARAVVCSLPESPLTADSIVDRLFEAASRRTKLIVVSHVTSPTALVIPVEEICRRANERGIAVCVDGPHALVTRDINLKKLNCDFYTASCHKWLCAPFGSGFLFVHPRQQKHIRPALVSWGGSIAGRQPSWKDEFIWLGTRNPAAFLAVPEALSCLDPAQVRQRGRTLTDAAERCLTSALGFRRLTTDPPLRCDPMISLELPESAPQIDAPADHQDPLQAALWERFRIEIPVVHWNGRRLLRVSAHLYNSISDIDRLVAALSSLQSDAQLL